MRISWDGLVPHMLAFLWRIFFSERRCCGFWDWKGKKLDRILDYWMAAHRWMKWMFTLHIQSLYRFFYYQVFRMRYLRYFNGNKKTPRSNRGWHFNPTVIHDEIRNIFPLKIFSFHNKIQSSSIWVNASKYIT